MSKKKKKKQRENKPQLSKLDKGIYFAITFFSLLVFIGLPYLIDNLRAGYFFSDANTIAWSDRLTALWFIPPLFVLFATIVLFCQDKIEKRTAIFGNKKVDYSKHNYQFYPICPVFYKGDKPKRKVPEAVKKERKILIVAWLILFIISCIFGCFGIFGRTELTLDGQIIKYSVFNNIKEQYYLSDISEIEYKTYLQGVTKGYDYSTYGIIIRLKNTDEYYSFNHKDFDNTNDQSIFTTSLDDMKYLRDSVYKDKKITYNKEIPLNKITEKNNMTKDEIEKLYEFFDENIN